MPLARIITENPEEALELAMHLRARGFEVQTVSPNQSFDNPADLEVELDTCDVKDVLARVMGFSGGEESYIFVAPGTLDEAIPDEPESYAEFVSKSPRVPVAKVIEDSPIATVVPTNGNSAQADESHGGFLDFDGPAMEVGRENPDAGHESFEDELAEGELPVPPSIRLVEDDPAEEPEIDEPAPELEIVLAKEALPSKAVPFASVAEAHADDIIMPAVEAEPLPLPAEVVVEAVASAPLAVEPVWAAQPASTVPQARSRRSDALFWRIAIPAAALAAIVVLAGSLWQRRHPAAGSLPESGTQQIPFQKPPTQSAPQTPPASIPQSPNSQVAVPSPSPQPQGPSSAPAQAVKSPAPAPPKATAPVAKSASRAKPPAKKARTQATQHKSTSGSHDSGLVARDTVTYFDRKPPGSPHASDASAK
jgi:hypothetical protein